MGIKFKESHHDFSLDAPRAVAILPDPCAFVPAAVNKSVHGRIAELAG